MRKGYINISNIKDVKIEKPKRDPINNEIKNTWNPANHYFKKLTEKYWDGDELKPEFKEDNKMPSTWIEYGGKKTLVKIVERYRKVQLRNDKSGKPVHRYDSYTSYEIYRNPETGGMYRLEDGDWIEEKQQKVGQDEILIQPVENPIPVDKTKTVVESKQLQLFL